MNMTLFYHFCITSKYFNKRSYSRFIAQSAWSQHPKSLFSFLFLRQHIHCCSTEAKAHLATVPFPRSFDSCLMLRQGHRWDFLTRGGPSWEGRWGGLVELGGVPET